MYMVSLQCKDMQQLHPLVVIALLNLPVQISNLVVPVLLSEKSSIHPASCLCDLLPVMLAFEGILSCQLASICKVFESSREMLRLDTVAVIIAVAVAFLPGVVEADCQLSQC